MNIKPCWGNRASIGLDLDLVFVTNTSIINKPFYMYAKLDLINIITLI